MKDLSRHPDYLCKACYLHGHQQPLLPRRPFEVEPQHSHSRPSKIDRYKTYRRPTEELEQGLEEQPLTPPYAHPKLPWTSLEAEAADLSGVSNKQVGQMGWVALG